jgi:DNA-binding GntR family transcriptional regulator
LVEAIAGLQRRSGLRPLVEAGTKAGRVLEEVREAIFDGRLPPGSLHSAQSIAAELRVSRTPVREALLQLEREEMVVFLPNRGVRIGEPRTTDIEEIYQLRIWLEVPATALAVKSNGASLGRCVRGELEAMLESAMAGDERLLWDHDRQFHKEILLASGNRRVAEYVDGLRAQLLLGNWTTSARHKRSLVETAEEHRPISEAIEGLDHRQASKAMRYHLEHTSAIVIDAFRRHPGRREESNGPDGRFQLEAADRTGGLAER